MITQQFKLILYCLLFTSSLTFCNVRKITTALSIAKQSFSSTKKQNAIRQLKAIINEIERESPDSPYIPGTREAIDRKNYRKATAFVNVYYCNKIYEKMKKDDSL